MLKIQLFYSLLKFFINYTTENFNSFLFCKEKVGVEIFVSLLMGFRIMLFPIYY